MAQHEASRTLVKSPPELWTECSDAASLARHLGEFGEIRITRLEPETAVAWEGERVSGTVRIEPSGWGTRVTLTAIEPEPEPVAEPEAEALVPEPEPELAPGPAPIPEPEPVAEPVLQPVVEQPAPPPPERPRSGFLYRMRLLFKPERAEPEPEPVLVPEPDPEPEPVVVPEPELVAPEPEPAPEPAEPAKPEPVPEPSGPDASKILASALESLGQAHHRPFSRG